MVGQTYSKVAKDDENPEESSDDDLLSDMKIKSID